MVAFPNNKFGWSSSGLPFYDHHHRPPRHFSPAITVTAITLLALLVLLQSPIALLFSSYDDQDEFLVFASSSASPTETTTSSQSSIAPPLVAQQSLQFQTSGNYSRPSVDNFSLPDGYVIEPYMWNLSLPTSIAVDSSNGSIYVAESIFNRYDKVDGVDDNSTSSSGILLSSPPSPSPISFSEQHPQVSIVKADIGNNDSSINFNQSKDATGGEINDENIAYFDNALNWPVIDMEVDSANGFLYAFHDDTTISRINMTSGEREDIISTDEEQEEVHQQPQDPLSLLINSSTQMALGGNDEGSQSAGDDEISSNHGSYKPTILYIPCKNNEDVDGLYDRYCILTLPIDSRDDGNVTVDNNSSINNDNPPSYVLENITSRPAGIAIINSSHSEPISSASSTYSFLISSSSSSSPSPSISEQERPFSLTRNQTSNPISNNNDNHNQLLIITSLQHSSDGTFGNHSSSNSDNEVTSVSYRTSNDSTDASAVPPSESTIYRANVFGLVESQDRNNSTNNTDNIYEEDNVTNYNNHQLQALPPRMDTLVNYPDSQLGKVVVVSVPFVINSSSPLVDTIDTNQSSLSDEGDEESISSLFLSSPPLLNTFGLNDTTAFVIDYGIVNSSTLAAPTHLPKIVMLDVKTGNIVPFLTLRQPDSNFMPVDITFDYINNDLYVLSIGNSPVEKGDVTNDINNNNQLNPGTSNNDNTGVIWKISYQGKGEEEETTANSSSSTSDNGTDDTIDNSNNGTDDETTSESSNSSSSSNDTSSSDNSSITDDSGIYEEEEDDLDDDEGGDNSSDEPSSTEDSDSNSSNNSSEDSDDDDSADGESSTDPSSGSSSSETDTTTTPSSSSTEGDSSSPSSQPSTQPQNDPPVAEDDSVTTEQNTPILVDVLANDRDVNVDDSLTIDTVDDESIQGGNVITISGGSNDDTGDNDNEEGADNDNNAEGNTNPKIQYTPPEGFFGNDEFTYTIIDKSGATDSAKVTVSVSEVVVVSHPIRYWLENEDGTTGELLEEAAQENDNSNDWSFKLGNFEVPIDFDVSDSNNDTMGILGAGEGNNNNNNNAYNQLAAQLLATKLNIQNGVSVCETVDNAIDDADAILQNIQYEGPSSTEDQTGESRDTAPEVIELLDEFNNNGCV